MEKTVCWGLFSNFDTQLCDEMFQKNFCTEHLWATTSETISQKSLKLSICHDVFNKVINKKMSGHMHMLIQIPVNYHTAQKIKFSFKDFFSNCDQKLLRCFKP